jgi:hypothetical protein
MTSPAATMPENVEAFVGKIPLVGKVQSLVYALLVGQWAVGFWSGLYVLVFQARWFGVSFKYTWDNLNLLWHFKAVPLIGHWMFDYYNVGRHIFARDAPEAVLGYAFVAMVIPLLVTKMRDNPPLLDRVMVRLGMPSPYQEQLGRHPHTSGLQYLFLVPSMLFAALPGEIAASVIIFGGMALAHHYGYAPGWLTPTGTFPVGPVHVAWVFIAIGIAGGKFFGHKPAVKAGQDIQRFYLGKRLALVYAADKILDKFSKGLLDHDKARDQLTGMRRSDPAIWYPATYRLMYRRMLAARVPVGKYGVVSTIATVLFVTVVVVVGGWGTFLRRYGITHGFWLPW